MNAVPYGLGIGQDALKHCVCFHVKVVIRSDKGERQEYCDNILILEPAADQGYHPTEDAGQRQHKYRQHQWDQQRKTTARTLNRVFRKYTISVGIMTISSYRSPMAKTPKSLAVRILADGMGMDNSINEIIQFRPLVHILSIFFLHRGEIMEYILPAVYLNSTHPESMLYVQLTIFFMATHYYFNLTSSFLGLLVWRWGV